MLGMMRAEPGWRSSAGRKSRRSPGWNGLVWNPGAGGNVQRGAAGGGVLVWILACDPDPSLRNRLPSSQPLHTLLHMM
jgi:hypothetical protein